jgi:hypothetical protein
MNAIAKKIDTSVTAKAAPSKALKTSSNAALRDVLILQIAPKTIVAKEEITPPHASQIPRSRILAAGPTPPTTIKVMIAAMRA